MKKIVERFVSFQTDWVQVLQSKGKNIPINSHGVNLFATSIVLQLFLTLSKAQHFYT